MRALTIALVLLLLSLPATYAGDLDVAREAGKEYAKFRERIAVEGPFYVAGQPYYVLDYVSREGVRASLVYDYSAGEFISGETASKVLATRDLKSLLLWDPLFYAIGDADKIPLAARYETQNVRNFAEFATLSKEEREQLEQFLADYEQTARDIAEVSRITNSMLYPKGIEFIYRRSSPYITINIRDTATEGHFSYEGFKELIDSYNTVYSDYQRLILDLRVFAGELEEYLPGETIREKWEVEMTKESLLTEVSLAGQNARLLKGEIDVRNDIASWPYNETIGTPEEVGRKEFPKGFLILWILLAVAALLFYFRKRPPAILLLVVCATLVGTLGQALVEPQIPKPEELISKKITDTSAVPVTILAEGVDESTIRELLKGFPLLLEGQGVYIRGPYYYYGRPNYLFDVVENNVSTGFAFLIDATTLRFVGDQRMAFQLFKAIFLSDMVQRQPLYTGVDHEAIADTAAESAPPLDVFLANLSTNIEEGQTLETSLVEKPDFETVMKLTKNYIKTFMLLHNLEKLTSPEETRSMTQGFSEQKTAIEAYARAMRGLSADEYLEARRAQYIGRSLNRLPLMKKLSAMGMSPSRAQVVHDLTSDLLYDNIFLWRLEKPRDPNLFARLAFKEGTFTLPGTANVTQS
ncbi:MAG: hypothetical protein V3T58_06725 [Candidatus Hydrothermarchaeales archaeon]